MTTPSPLRCNLTGTFQNVKSLDKMESPGKKASPLVNVGISEGGSLNNTDDQGAYTGSGPPGAEFSCHWSPPGGLDIKAPREADGVDVGDGGPRAFLEPLKAAWGNFIDQVGKDLNGWDWFSTFTFRDPNNPKYPNWTKPGWKYAHTALRTWASTIMSKRLGDTQPYWLGVMEYQHWRGVPHWHILVGNTGKGTMNEERRMDWVDWWYEHYGIARILPYDEKLGAKYYLGKYLTKELADVQWSTQLTLDHRQRWQANAANDAWLAAMTSE